MEHIKVILMESAAKIRRLVLRDGVSIRSISRSTGLSRTTIRKYLSDASPPAYNRSAPAVRYKLRDFEDCLQLMFEQDQLRPKRERRTALKLFEALLQEGYTGSYSPVCRFIKSLKEAETGSTGAFIPLAFDAGDALQFDWSEEHVVR
jgi:transposase